MLKDYDGLKLAALALCAEFIFVIVAFIAVIPFLLIQSVVLESNYFVALAIAVFLFVWWMTQPDSIQLSHHQIQPDIESLAKFVNAIAKRLNAPRIHRIVINDELNAGAMQSGGFMGLLFVKRTLIIGIPLMEILNEQELAGVIGHELGHFSRQHGRLGHWIYRVRYKWSQYFDHSNRYDNILDVILKPIATRFVPYFLQKSSLWSRRCEFEADQSAALASSPRAIVDALTKLQEASYAQQTLYKATLNLKRIESVVPPSNYWQGLIHAVSNPSEPILANAIAHDDMRSRKNYDTHPPLFERAANLKTSVESTNWHDSSGQAIFGDTWHIVISESNLRWMNHALTNWRFDHLRLNWLKQQSSSGYKNVDLLTDNTDLDKIIVSYELRPNDSDLRDLETFVFENQMNAFGRFYFGNALLERNDAKGLVHLKAAIKLDETFGLACAILITYFVYQFGTDLENSVASKRLLHYQQKAYQIHARLLRKILNSDFSALELNAIALLRSSFQQDTLLDGCWAIKIEFSDVLNKPWKVNLLIIRCDPKRLRSEKLTENSLVDRYARILDSVTQSNQLSRVMIFYTTEPFNPNIYNQLKKNELFELKSSLTKINQNLIKIDSL